MDAEQPIDESGPKPVRTWRPMLLWTAAILAAAGLAWLGAKAWEVCDTRAALAENIPRENALAMLGGREHAVPRLLMYLRLHDALAPNKDSAVSLLGDCGRQAVPHLILLLHHHRPKLRAAAAGSLGRIRPATVEALPALTEALGDEDGNVRAAAAWSVVPVGQEAPERVVIRTLVKTLKDGWPGVRANAASALGEIGSPAREAVPVLIETLKDPDNGVYFAAAKALISIAPPAKEAVPAIMGVLKDIRRPSDALWVAMKLDPTAQEVAPALASVLKAGEKLYADNPDDTEKLHWLVNARGAVASQLSNLGPQGRQAVPAFAVWIKDDNGIIRGTLLDFLAWVQPPPRQTIAVMVQALSDKEVYVRNRAVSFLRNLGPESSEGVPELIQALKNKEWRIQDIALDALGRIGPGAKDAEPALLELLKDERGFVRYRVTQTLKRIRTEEPPK